MQMKVRSDLPAWLVNNGFMTGAEIGVYKGEFTEQFCKAGVKLIYAIDPWAEYTIIDKYNPVETVSQKRQDFLFGHTKRQLNKFTNYKIIRKHSLDAVKDFQDNSLDFVYIDGDHSFKAVAGDIYEWSRKVRKGGVVSGHDYTSLPIYGSQVKPVVDAFVEAFNIKSFRTIGSESKSDIRARGDKYYSWMWIKE